MYRFNCKIVWVRQLKMRYNTSIKLELIRRHYKKCSEKNFWISKFYIYFINSRAVLAIESFADWSYFVIFSNNNILVLIRMKIYYVQFQTIVKKKIENHSKNIAYTLYPNNNKPFVPRRHKTVFETLVLLLSSLLPPS